jgi:hypothetical protein
MNLNQLAVRVKNEAKKWRELDKILKCSLNCGYSILDDLNLSEDDNNYILNLGGDNCRNIPSLPLFLKDFGRGKCRNFDIYYHLGKINPKESEFKIVRDLVNCKKDTILIQFSSNNLKRIELVVVD